MDRRQGLTLVEVVAGLLLLSSLLTGILVAYGRHVRQIRRAQQRLQAVAQADRMLTEWSQVPSGVPTDGNGDVLGDGKLRWQIRPVESTEAQAALGVRVVRLEILEDTPNAEREKNDPLVAVDLVAPAAAQTVDENDKDQKSETDGKKEKMPSRTALHSTAREGREVRQ